MCLAAASHSGLIFSREAANHAVRFLGDGRLGSIPALAAIA